VTLTRDPSGDVIAADVDMGPVTLGEEACASPSTGSSIGATPRASAIPHLVCFVVDPDVVPVASHGPRIELDSRFPQRTNVEFVRVHPPDVMYMRVWERGSARRCRAEPVRARGRGRAQPRCSRRAGAGPGSGRRVEVTLAETVRLGGPVVHVFDVDIDIDAAVDRRVEQTS